MTTRATALGISIPPMLLWLPRRTDQVPPPTIENIWFACFYVFVLFSSLLCNHKSFIHYNCLIEVSVDDWSVCIIMHTYIPIYIHKYSHTDTHLHLHTWCFAYSIYYTYTHTHIYIHIYIIFVYMAHHFILLRLDPFDLKVDRVGWWFDHSVS